MYLREQKNIAMQNQSRYTLPPCGRCHSSAALLWAAVNVSDDSRKKYPQSLQFNILSTH